MTNPATTQPKRFARAVAAACNANAWRPGCNYPECLTGDFICWNRWQVYEIEAAINAWEGAQRL